MAVKTCLAVFVGVIAIVIGLFASGVARQLGIFKYIDQNGPPDSIGCCPVFHIEEDWRFKHDAIVDGALKGKLYLVTGANTGIGYWTARHLAQKGANVVLACRSEKKCTQAVANIKAENQEVTPDQLEIGLVDLSSLRSIKTFAEEFVKAHPKLDSLILNAGLGFGPFSLTQDGIERVMAVNHFGHFYLTQLLLPIVEAAGTDAIPSTIVSTSSGAHFFAEEEADRMTTLEGINDGSSGMAQYGSSKAAGILFTRELAARLTERSANVLVNAVNPGAVQTDFYRGMFESINSTFPSWLANQLASLLQGVVDNIAWHPKDAVLTLIACAAGPDLIRAKVTGKYYHPIFREMDPAEYARDPTRQKAFWEMSERVIDGVIRDLD